MKIIYALILGDIGGGGGSNNAVLSIIDNMLQRTDVEPFVVFRRGTEGSFTRWLEEKGVRYELIDGIFFRVWPKVSCFRDLLAFPYRVFDRLVFGHHKAVKKMREIIRREKPDIVHVNNSTLYYGIKAADKEKVASLWHIREYGDFDFDFYPTKHSYIKMLQKHFTVSISDDIAEHFGLTENNKHFVVYDGVMSSKNTFYRKDKKDYFLFVGRVTENKGVTEMLKAFAQYAERNFEGELWIAGRIPEQDYEQRIKKFVKEHRIENRVRFLGFRSDRYELMQQARALIVPSLFEGFGFITVEAMMNGCLVIGRNSSGTKMIMDAVDGAALPYDSVDGMATRMYEVMRHKSAFYEEMILKAQQLATAKYSTEKNGDEIYNIYKKLLIKWKKLDF